MKRTLWILLLLSAATAALVPSLGFAATAFKATEVTTLTMTSGAGGGALVMFQDTGMVIDDVADSTFVQYTGGVATTYTGYQAITQAIADGKLAATAGSLSSSSQGIVPDNAVNGNGNGSYFAIAEANSVQLGQTLFGGISLQTSNTNQCVLRETYFGDANMDGSVNGGDYGIWLAQFNTNANPVSWVTGDFNGDGLVNGGDRGIWLASYNANLTGLGGLNGPAQLVPEPGAMALCLAAAGGLLMCGLRRFRKN